MSLVMRVAEDVASLISSMELEGGPFPAVASPAPEVDFSTLQDRKILVVPSSLQRMNADRGSTSLVVKVGVCYAERISEGEIAGRIGLVETMAEGLSRRMLLRENQGYAFLSAVEFEAMYDVELLRSSRVFFSMFTVTAKGIRK